MKFDDLDKKYDSFRSPFGYIKVDGQAVDNKKVSLWSIEVVLTTGLEASMCRVEASSSQEGFPDGKLNLDAETTGLFRLGAKIEVFLGYLDEKKCDKVFEGFITTLELALAGASVTHHIEGMDVKAFMMNNLRSMLHKGVKKYSEAVAKVLKNYSGMMNGQKIEATDEIETVIEQYNQSDYDFVAGLARKLNFMFYVVQGKVYFVGYSSAKTASLKLTPGPHLYEFHRTLTLAQQMKKVSVRSNNETEPDKPTEATVTTGTMATVGKGSKSSADVSKKITDTMEMTMIDNTVQTVAQAKTRAEAELARYALQFATGHFETVGAPEIEVGKYMTLEGMGSEIDNDYFITEVRHEMQSGNYRTTCKFCINKI